jgi:hypothetical protein
LLGLLALVASIYRRHLTGEALFLGNFDRLNSFLNTLWLQVHAWKLGRFGGWDDSMFMGRNLYALPFTYPNPFNYVVALFPDSSFYVVAGLVSILLQVLAGWCAYWFIHDICRDRWAAFCGAAMYQFSALAVLKTSQNDMSFAVLIDIPLLLLALRRLDPDRPSVGFLALCAVLTHLLVFCFLQKVAYALLLAVGYALTLSWARRSWLPVLTLAAAGGVALIAAFPRLYGIVREMRLLQRQISPDFDMRDFAALYHWQNFKAFDVWRWFNDGLFGRFFSEVSALHNDLNISEGMLMFSGMLTPFLVISGLFRWNGQWGGIFRNASAEIRLFYTVIALAIGTVASMTVYRVFWELFLRLDFTHTRFVIAALIPQCTLVALFIARLRHTNSTSSLRVILVGLALGIGACASVYYLAGLPERAVPVALTDAWKDALHYPFGGFSALARSRAGRAKISGSPLAWMNAAILNRVILTALVAVLVAYLSSWRRSRGYIGAGVAFFLVGFLVADVWSYANLQNNGTHVGGLLPFRSSNSYWPAQGTFVPSQGVEKAELKARLEGDDYRLAFLSKTTDLPLFTAPHVAPTWGLRVVEGYSTGIPVRLAALPWPNWVLGLRTMTFGSRQVEDMPWGLMGFTNVKHAIWITAPLYRLGPAGKDVAPLEVVVNPDRVTPRVFVPEHVERVSSMKAARDRFFPSNDPNAGPALDPVKTSMVETLESLPELEQTSGTTATFAGDKITIRVAPTTKPRIVVLNELFHPEWHAYTGKRETSIFPANIVMRGVLVPADAAEVVLRFEPFGRPGHIIVSAGLALVLALFWSAIQRRRVKSSPRQVGRS